MVLDDYKSVSISANAVQVLPGDTAPRLQVVSFTISAAPYGSAAVRGLVGQRLLSGKPTSAAPLPAGNVPSLRRRRDQPGDCQLLPVTVSSNLTPCFTAYPVQPQGNLRLWAMPRRPLA